MPAFPVLLIFYGKATVFSVSISYLCNFQYQNLTTISGALNFQLYLQTPNISLFKDELITSLPVL